MKLTQGGTVVEELKGIPKRNWWKITFAVPPIIFLVLGVIDFVVSTDHRTTILLIGLLLASNHLATSILQNILYKKIAGSLSLIFSLLVIYQLFVVNSLK